MSIRNRSLVFLALTFVFSWAAAIGGWAAGWRETQMAVAALTAMMTGPAIAALVCIYAFEPKGERLKALGLHWTPNLWWLTAWGGILLIALLSVVLTIVLSGREFVPIAEVQRQAVIAEGLDPSGVPPSAVLILAAAIVGALFNSVVLTFTEELGWRGYLHHLWRPFGFWRASLATGFIWGVWHAPAILFYGLNYPENRQIGVVIFIAFCMLFSPLMTFIRDRGRSVIAAGIAHGTLNAMGALTVLSVSNPAFPWLGIVGVGGFIAVAAAVAAVAAFRGDLAPKPIGA